ATGVPTCAHVHSGESQRAARYCRSARGALDTRGRHMGQAWAAVGWKIASLIDTEVSAGGVGWCFVLRADGQEHVVVARGWARARWEASQPGVPVSADSRFQLASMSKPVTNLATRALVDDWETARHYLNSFRGHLPNPLPWPPASGPGIPTGITSNLVA